MFRKDDAFMDLENMDVDSENEIDLQIKVNYNGGHFEYMQISYNESEIVISAYLVIENMRV